MPWGFETGRSYRRGHVHDRYGGNPQSGISPTQNGVVLLFGRQGTSSYGYTNGMRPDGIYEYFGEGQTGPMRMDKGNRAIRDHANAGRALLAFQIMSDKQVQFIGEMAYESHRIVEAIDREGELRPAFIFELRPMDALAAVLEEDQALDVDTIDVLRQRALAAGRINPAETQVPRTVVERSRDVKNYVLARAAGRCECCGENAPFNRQNGTPYLEAHHTHRLSDGGPDLISHVIALHPVCHRRAHHAADRKAFNEGLKVRLQTIEPGV